ncbi:unnamed protein product [Adineta steineri]|uniref:Uncharacterized protein n=1 Tax=Adineta steineri TaxID=433720 RepID=A0A819DUQ9_9BILA|nr:unnamed protein product [Adineta steineri]
MNHLRLELVEQLPQTILERQSPVSTHDNDASATDATLNDQLAQLRRRAPTRHSIKSLTGRKALSKQNSTNEIMFGFKRSNKTKRKLTKTPAIQTNASIESKILYNVPSVSQIAPLPENKSHGILPVLSLDGRDSSDIIQSNDQLEVNTEKNDHSNGHQPVGE